MRIYSERNEQKLEFRSQFTSFLCTTLQNKCCEQINQYVNEISKIDEYHCPSAKKRIIEDLEPVSPIAERLVPFRTPLEEDNQSFKEKISEITLVSKVSSMSSVRTKNIFKLEQSKMLKKSTHHSCKLLKPQKDEQEQIFQEMRKQIILSENQRKAREQKILEQEGFQDDKKSIGFKISFNYDGSIIRSKSLLQNRVLSDKGIQGQMSQKILKPKLPKTQMPNLKLFQSKSKRNITIKPKKNQQKIATEDIYFTNIHRLYNEAIPSKGIKMSEVGVVIEERQPRKSTESIKLSLQMGQIKKLKQEEYKRIKKLSERKDQSKVKSSLKLQENLQKSYEKVIQSIQADEQTSFKQSQFDEEYLHIHNPSIHENVIKQPLGLILGDKFLKLDQQSVGSEKISQKQTLSEQKLQKNLDNIFNSVKLPKIKAKGSNIFHKPEVLQDLRFKFSNRY